MGFSAMPAGGVALCVRIAYVSSSELTRIRPGKGIFIIFCNFIKQRLWADGSPNSAQQKALDVSGKQIQSHMAWLPMYLLNPDVELLNDWLNQEDEIAFLIPNGHKRWKAERTHNILGDLQDPPKSIFGFMDAGPIEYSLWHVPSGPLPLIQPHKSSATLRFKEEDWKYGQIITNPWEGWTEQVTGRRSNLPYFESHPGIIELTIMPTDMYRICISHFGWIGNYFSVLGNKANPMTDQFWKRLRRMVKKVATHIPRQNQSILKKEIYAFPSAMKEIARGMQCE